MFLRRKNSKSITHKAVRESINLNKANGIQILHPENEAVLTIIENNWLEQFIEMKLENFPVQQRALKKTNLIVKWWEN